MKIYLLLFLTSFCNADLEAELKHVLDSYDYEPECAFNYTQVNSTTIKFFPKCEKVFGIIVINEKTDLTETQVAKETKTMKSLYGGILMENSNFTGMSFLKSTKSDGGSHFDINCENYGIFIINNTRFNDNTKLKDIYTSYNEEENRECDVWFLDNPKLDANDACENGYLWYSLDIKTKGNLKDCGCLGDEIAESTLPQYTNCDVLWRGLKMQNITKSNNMLANITDIRGAIDIQNSNFQNLSFLQNFRMLKFNNPLPVEKMAFNLKDNLHMTRLAMPKFQEIDNVGVIKLYNFENLHPDFCITYEEIFLFLKSEVSFSNLHAKMCEGPVNLPGAQVCYFESMANLTEGCGAIIGDLFVGAGDEEDFEKLKNVRILFGSITVEKTNLESLGGLAELGYIVYLGDGPVIQVISNKNLKNLELSVTNIYTRDNSRQAIFQDNHPDIFFFSDGKCQLLADTDDANKNYRTRLNFTGSDCGDTIEPATTQGQNFGTVECQLFFVFLIIFLLFAVL